MKLKTLTSLLLVSLIIISCDDSTDGIGTTLTNKRDQLDITTDTFNVTTKSIAANAVLSRNISGYIGKFKDPETETDITADFMTQFGVLENFYLPEFKNIVSKENGLAYADSCEIRLYNEDTVGDSLAPMHLKMYELSRPVSDSKDYYTNFDPVQENDIRNGGLTVEKAYTLADVTSSDKEKKAKGYSPSIRIPLNKPYTDKNGKTYKNYGTYIMQKYYSPDSVNFKNSYKLIHNIMPGFYFKSVGGSGSIGKIFNSILFVYFRMQYKDSVYTRAATFGGTQEVMQTTHIVNDGNALQQLINNQSGTYLKTPAGIFTQMTLPVEEIVAGHEKDSINSAKITLQRINNSSTNSFALEAPKQVLMIPVDSIQTFFEHHNYTNYKNSFVAKLNQNGYTFNNISSIIRTMYESKKNGTASPNWNQVVVIPVTTTSMSIQNGGYTSTYQTGVYHDMSIKSTKIEGGDTPVKLTVIYSKFK